MKETVSSATPHEAITSQQPRPITYHPTESLTYQQDQQDPRADMLMSKTLFAADMMRITKENAEKEVSLYLYICLI
jgi:hypothetical protein